MFRRASNAVVPLCLLAGCGAGAAETHASPLPVSSEPRPMPPTPGWVDAARWQANQCAEASRSFVPGPAPEVASSPLRGTVEPSGKPFGFTSALAYPAKAGWFLVLYDHAMACGDDEPKRYDGVTVSLRVEPWVSGESRRVSPLDISVRYPFGVEYREQRSCTAASAAIRLLETPANPGARGRARVRIEWSGQSELEGELEFTVCPRKP